MCLQPVQKGKVVGGERLDVTDSPRVKGVGGESRDVTESVRGKGVGGERRVVMESARGKVLFGGDVLLWRVQGERCCSGEMCCYRQCKG